MSDRTKKDRLRRLAQRLHDAKTIEVEPPSPLDLRLIAILLGILDLLADEL